MARKSSNTFRIVNPAPSAGESDSAVRSLVAPFRPEHWEFRKSVNLIATKFPDNEPAQWILKLLDKPYDEYGTQASRFIPFVLEYFVDRNGERDTTTAACLWIISNWWHFWGHGPRPTTKQVHRTRVTSVRDDAWLNSLVCPVCNKLWEKPEELKERTAILQKFSLWLSKHAKDECQKKLSKYQQRKNEAARRELEEKFLQPFIDTARQSEILKLEGTEAEAALKLAMARIAKLERQNRDFEKDRADQIYFHEQLFAVTKDVREHPEQLRLTGSEYRELQKVRELIGNWEIRIEQLSKHLEIRGTKTEIKTSEKAVRDLRKAEKQLLQKAGYKE